MGREEEKKKTCSGRTPAENSDKLSDKGRAGKNHSLVSVKSSPLARPPYAPAYLAYPDATPLFYLNYVKIAGFSAIYTTYFK